MGNVIVNSAKPPYVYDLYGNLGQAQETIYPFNMSTDPSVLSSANFSKNQTGCPNNDTSYYFNTQRAVWYSITDASSITAITSGSNTAVPRMNSTSANPPWILTNQTCPWKLSVTIGSNANIEIAWWLYTSGITYSQSWWNTYRANNYLANNTLTNQQVWNLSVAGYTAGTLVSFNINEIVAFPIISSSTGWGTSTIKFLLNWAIKQTVTYRRSAILLATNNGQWSCSSSDNNPANNPYDTNNTYYKLNLSSRNPLFAYFASTTTTGFLIPCENRAGWINAVPGQTVGGITLYSVSGDPSTPVATGGNSFPATPGWYWAYHTWTYQWFEVDSISWNAIQACGKQNIPINYQYSLDTVVVYDTLPPYVYDLNGNLIPGHETFHHFDNDIGAFRSSANFSKNRTGAPNVTVPAADISAASGTPYTPGHYFNSQRCVWYYINDFWSIYLIQNGSNNTIPGPNTTTPNPPWMLNSNSCPYDSTITSNAGANIEIVFGRSASGITYSQSWLTTYRANNYAGTSTATSQQVWNLVAYTAASWQANTLITLNLNEIVSFPISSTTWATTTLKVALDSAKGDQNLFGGPVNVIIDKTKPPYVYGQDTYTLVPAQETVYPFDGADSTCFSTSRTWSQSAGTARNPPGMDNSYYFNSYRGVWYCVTDKTSVNAIKSIGNKTGVDGGATSTNYGCPSPMLATRSHPNDASRYVPDNNPTYGVPNIEIVWGRATSASSFSQSWWNTYWANNYVSNSSSTTQQVWSFTSNTLITLNINEIITYPAGMNYDTSGQVNRVLWAVTTLQAALDKAAGDPNLFGTPTASSPSTSGTASGSSTSGTTSGSGTSGTTSSTGGTTGSTSGTTSSTSGTTSTNSSQQNGGSNMSGSQQNVTYRRTATLLGDQSGQWLCSSTDNTSTSMGPDTGSLYYQMRSSSPPVKEFASSITTGFFVPGHNYYQGQPLVQGQSFIIYNTTTSTSMYGAMDPATPVVSGGNSFPVTPGYHWAYHVPTWQWYEVDSGSWAAIQSAGQPNKPANYLFALNAIIVDTSQPAYVYDLSGNLIQARESVLPYNNHLDDYRRRLYWNVPRNGAPSAPTGSPGAYYFNSHRGVWYYVSDPWWMYMISVGYNQVIPGPNTTDPSPPWMLVGQSCPWDWSQKAGPEPVSTGQPPSNANIEIIWARYASPLTYTQSWWSAYRANNYAANSSATSQLVWNFSAFGQTANSLISLNLNEIIAFPNAGGWTTTTLKALLDYTITRVTIRTRGNAFVLTLTPLSTTPIWLVGNLGLNSVQNPPSANDNPDTLNAGNLAANPTLLSPSAFVPDAANNLTGYIGAPSNIKYIAPNGKLTSYSSVAPYASIVYSTAYNVWMEISDSDLGFIYLLGNSGTAQTTLTTCPQYMAAQTTLPGATLTSGQIGKGPYVEIFYTRASKISSTNPKSATTPPSLTQPTTSPTGVPLTSYINAWVYSGDLTQTPGWVAIPSNQILAEPFNSGGSVQWRIVLASTLIFNERQALGQRLESAFGGQYIQAVSAVITAQQAVNTNLQTIRTKYNSFIQTINQSNLLTGTVLSNINTDLLSKIGNILSSMQAAQNLSSSAISSITQILSVFNVIPSNPASIQAQSFAATAYASYNTISTDLTNLQTQFNSASAQYSTAQSAVSVLQNMYIQLQSLNNNQVTPANCAKALSAHLTLLKALKLTDANTNSALGLFVTTNMPITEATLTSVFIAKLTTQIQSLEVQILLTIKVLLDSLLMTANSYMSNTNSNENAINQSLQGIQTASTKFQATVQTISSGVALSIAQLKTIISTNKNNHDTIKTELTDMQNMSTHFAGLNLSGLQTLIKTAQDYLNQAGNFDSTNAGQVTLLDNKYQALDTLDVAGLLSVQAQVNALVASITTNCTPLVNNYNNIQAQWASISSSLNASVYNWLQSNLNSLQAYQSSLGTTNTKILAIVASAATITNASAASAKASLDKCVQNFNSSLTDLATQINQIQTYYSNFNQSATSDDVVKIYTQASKSITSAQVDINACNQAYQNALIQLAIANTATPSSGGNILTQAWSTVTGWFSSIKI